MPWRITLELAGAGDTRQVHEIGGGERLPNGPTAATLGLGLTESKAILAALQRHLVAAQVDEHCRHCQVDGVWPERAGRAKLEG